MNFGDDRYWPLNAIIVQSLSCLAIYLSQHLQRVRKTHDSCAQYCAPQQSQRRIPSLAVNREQSLQTCLQSQQIADK